MYNIPVVPKSCAMNPVRGLTAVIALIIVALKILPMKNRKSGLSASAMVCFLKDVYKIALSMP